MGTSHRLDEQQSPCAHARRAQPGKCSCRFYLGLREGTLTSGLGEKDLGVPGVWAKRRWPQSQSISPRGQHAAPVAEAACSHTAHNAPRKLDPSPLASSRCCFSVFWVPVLFRSCALGRNSEVRVTWLLWVAVRSGRPPSPLIGTPIDTHLGVGRAGLV